jgi:signal transduction histidine kinase/ligand-binding sensor domain-containing protein
MRQVISRGMALSCMFLASRPCARALDPSLDVGQYAHTAWKIREGFSKGAIYSIAQTPDGYLWLGTDYGLLRFDGVRNVSWEPPSDQHLPSTRIYSLLAAHDGTLWIGTMKGLASWKSGKLTQYPELAGQGIFTLLEDGEGTVWVGGIGFPPPGRLCAIRRGSVQCYGEDGSLGAGVSRLIEDRQGNLWVATRSGLWRWKPGVPQFYPLPDEPGSIVDLAEDNDGTILITMKRGIGRLVDGKIKAYPFKPTIKQFEARRLLRDRDGGLWIGTSDRGILHIHQGRMDEFAPSDGLSGDDVDFLFQDHEGNVWVATLDGLDRFREFAITTLTVKQGLSNPRVFSVLAGNDGGVWLASAFGLDRWKENKVTTYDSHEGKLDGLAPNSLFQDGHGRVWASTDHGIGYIKNDRFVPLTGVPAGEVLSMAEDTTGDLWISNVNSGLIRVRQGKVRQQIPWSELNHRDPASAMVSDRVHGGMWLGFFNGGLVYFADGRIRASYTADDALGEGRVNSLRNDLDGALWVSTEGGLSRLKTGHIATLKRRNGLPCDSVHWLAQDDNGSFWLYMPCGLVRLPKTELDSWAAAADVQRDSGIKVQSTVFDSSDGVRSLANVGTFTPQLAKSAGGELWFLPWDGVSIINPRRLALNELPPPVHIEQVTADRKSFDATENIRLPPLVRNLEIDYTALSLVVAEKVFFRYKLEGVDRDWQDARTRRQAFYTDLPPGTYQFRVIACNNSGVWNETGDQLDFSVAPAWFQTNLFRVACAAVFLLILWALYQLRLRQLAHQFNITLEARVNERTRIARELHDTLLQSFQGLTLHFQRARNLLPDRAPEAIQTLDKALDGAEQAIVEGRAAIYDLRPPAPAAKVLAEDLTAFGEELVAKETNDKEPVHFRMVVEGSPHALRPNVHVDIFRIAREALRNAFSHSHGHLIETELAYTEKLFRLRVRDDGKGIDPDERVAAEQTGHWGLKGMRERAEYLGGELEVWSEPGAGTEIELKVPASIAYDAPASKGSSWQFRKPTRNQ